MKKIILPLLFLTVLTSSAFAGRGYEIDWQRHETEHFVVYYYEDLAPAAEAMVSLLEDIYQVVVERYKWAPKEKTRLVLLDNADYSNGSTIALFNEVRLWVAQEDMLLRGRHDWYWDLIAHEYAHAVSMDRGNSFGRLVNGINIAAVGATRGGDLQTGFSIFFPGTMIPRWFSEGVAQYDSARVGHDSFDSHRNMLLRSAMLSEKHLDEDNLLIINNKDYVGAELVYNQGFAIINWMVEKNGPEVIDQLMEVMAENWYWDFGCAIEKVTGKGWDETFKLWEKETLEKYRRQIKEIGAIVEGRPVVDKNMFNVYTLPAPNTEAIAYIAYPEGGYSGSLYFQATTGDDREPKKLVDRISSQFAFAPGGKKIIYSDMSEPDIYRRFYNDLYTVDIESGESEPLTENARLSTPSYSTDGDRLVAILSRAGKRDLALVDPTTGEYKVLTDFPVGQAVYRPVFSPDGRIFFELSGADRSDIWSINIDGGDLRAEIAGPADVRDLSFSKDGKYLFYASDETGIFNIYRVEQKTGARVRLTNVSGGAFMPSATTDGAVVYYSNFKDAGYRIYALDATSPIIKSGPAETELIESVSVPYPDATTLESIDFLTDTRPITLVPEMVFENNTIKAGMLLDISDHLERHHLIAEGLLGLNEKDYHIAYMYDGWYPTLFAGYDRYERSGTYSYADENRRLGITQRSFIDYASAGMEARIYKSNHLGVNYGYYNISTEVRQADYSAVLLTNHSVSLNYRYGMYRSTVNSDINPVGGREFNVNASYNWSHYPNAVSDAGYEFPKDYDFFSIYALYAEHIALPYEMGLEIELLVGMIGRDVYPIEEYYLGGLLDFRRYGEISFSRNLPGYAPYSISGEAMALLNLNWRFPLAGDIGYQLGPFYFDKLYGAVFADAGTMARYKGEKFDDYSWDNVYTDAGIELRLAMNLFYRMPWNSFIRLAHGFQDPEKKPVRVYLGIGTGW